MIRHTKKWILAFSITTALTLPTNSWAEIPFNEARGMLQATKPEYRRHSPFWAMVALHGKMLENIRFFGNYRFEKTEDKDVDDNIVIREADVGNDAIAVLLKRLFNSPDGVQFVATTYEGDPVGNLSRHLEKTNDIIEILVGESAKSENPELKQLIDELTGIGNEMKVINESKKAAPPTEEMLKKFNELKTKKVQIAKRKKELSSVENKPVSAADKSKRIKVVLDSMIEEEIHTDNQISNKNQEFAELVVRAYNKENDLANPTNNPNQYLYPENIVITALLTFFVKIADSADDLKKLPFIMNSSFKKNLSFTKEQYEKIKNTPDALNGIILNQNENSDEGIHNIEYTFLMEEGFRNWESPFPSPVSYSRTSYRGSEFPDCGETSLRNILSLILAAHNRGMISQDALTHLKKTIQVNDPTLLGQNTPFFKMVSFFNKNNDLSKASQSNVHEEWADVVSNLNQAQSRGDLNAVIYGNSVTLGEPNIFEIKSNLNPTIKGIISMFNVIAKLIPDTKLMEPWNENREVRLKQIAEKLNRLCELLSWKNVELSWSIGGGGQEIKHEFVNIIFMNHNSPIFEWSFVPGHFQLDPLSTPQTDWRTSFNTAEEAAFPNEWMASLFLKPNETKLLKNDNYGNVFPLALLYNSGLRGIDGALSSISLVLYKNTDQQRLPQFLPLITRWIEKNPVFLSDPHALERISLLIYGNTEIQRTLDKKGYENLKNANIDHAEKNPNEVFQKVATKNLQAKLVMISKHCIECTNLNLNSLINPQKITDAALEKLTNLESLDLSFNTMISNNALIKLTNLKNLNLSSNTLITDEALGKLTNIESLDLSMNKKISNDALIKLTNLKNLNLSSNTLITDEALGKLTNIEILNLGSNAIITGNILEKLKNLKNLGLSDNEKISNEALIRLTTLESLNLDSNFLITGETLEKLANLKNLDLAYNSTISNAELGKHTNLKSLNLSANTIITDETLGNLIDLESLDLSYNNTITVAPLKMLTNLKNLKVRKTKNIDCWNTNLIKSSNPKIQITGCS